MQENCPVKAKKNVRLTIVQVSVPLLLHGLLKAAVEDLVKCADPLVHLGFTVCSQQERALILHLQLEGKPAHLAVLKDKGHNICFFFLGFNNLPTHSEMMVRKVHYLNYTHA